LGVGPKFWRGGGAKFAISARLKLHGPASLCPCARYNMCPSRAITPKTSSLRARQTGLNFRNFDFFPIFGATLSPRRGASATFLYRTIVLLTLNKRCKFQPRAASPSRDIDLGICCHRIWSQNQPEKTKSEKRERPQKSQ